MRKKGLSTIVITLIIILISLVAVGIIWVVVRNVIQTGTKEVTIGQFTLDAKIKDVNVYNLTNNISLIVRRNPGVGEFSKMNFVFYDGKNSEVVTQPVSLNELEEKWFMFHLNKLNVSELISVSIFPYVRQDEKEILGNILDKYTVRGQGSAVIPACTPLINNYCSIQGYVCGSWGNNTCSGNLNCGACGGATPVCNSSGRCVASCTPLINNYCSVQGYECGYWGNNTCSGNLSCGTCSGGQICNASGRCVDVTAPVRSNAAPTGILAAGTTSTTISLSTNENAICRYSLSAGTAYASMRTFSTTGTTTHSNLTTGLVNGGSYTYYVRCNDTAGNFNTNDYTISFSVSSLPSGNVYWVSSTGAATWTNCKSATPLSGASACSYLTANTNAVPGDTVYYRGGTYSGITGSAINPTNTGTAGNIITFSSYNNEDVQFVSSGMSSTAVNLDSEYGTIRSYIKVNDLHFSNFNRHLWIRRGNHNEIAYCSFIGMPAGSNSSTLEWSGSYVYRQATYNWIHHNTFGTYGACGQYGTDYGVVFQLGLETSTTDNTQYNLVEYNEMYQGGHHVVSLNGKYNMYRNNYFHNEPWCPIGTPTYATRTMFQTGADGDGKYNLVEENKFGYGGPKNKDEIGGAGGTMAGAYNIWRKNTFLQVYTDSMYVTKYSGQTDVKYNKVYNNVFWHGGYGRYQYYPSGTAPSVNWEDRYTHGIVVEEGSSGTGVYNNTFKNNIFYENSDLLGTAYSIISRYYDSGLGWVTRVPIFQNISNNWFDNAGDPKFIDLTGTPNPMNPTQFDFHLQASSPVINAGAYLTNITSATGSGTSFIVKDAGYFFYPWGGINIEIPTATIVGDTIQLAGQTQRVQITNIDYATNTITVNAPLSWTQGQGVGLTYEGSAPDMGAYEYV